MCPRPTSGSSSDWPPRRIKRAPFRSFSRE
jgi:hypothetical protein